LLRSVKVRSILTQFFGKIRR